MLNSIREPIITIFMPVYNGSKYLEASINSILKQSFKNFELICVDDSSTDESYLILKHFAEKDSRVVIYQKPNGGNVPSSWNFVMPYIKGDYIMYMSQDDLLSVDTLELNYNRMIETNSDIVLPDLVYFHENNNNNRIKIGYNGNRDTILSGEQAFILSLDWKIHGFGLFKSEIMKSEAFDENVFNSDEYITRKNFLKSKYVAFSRGKFFYRLDNPNAITKVFKPHTITALITDQKIVKIMREKKIKKIHVVKYGVKSFIRMIYYYIKYIIKSKKYDVSTKKAINRIFKRHVKYLFLCR